MSLPITTPQQFRAVVTHSGALFHCMLTYNQPLDYIVDHIFALMNFTKGQPYYCHLHGNGFKLDCRDGFIEYRHDMYSPEARRIIAGIVGERK